MESPIVIGRLQSTRALFLALLVAGTIVRLGYGVARQNDALAESGTEFMARWDHDALEHVLIAKSLIDTGEYRVARVPGLESKQVRGVGQDASYKAPLYQFFLAGVFAVSGYDFFLFFPLQALIGGILSGLAGLVALETFRRRSVAAFAGASAAVHPVLVNTASQPYNENLYLALMFGSIWAFVTWRREPRLRWAVTCGILGGLAMLCRESAGSLLLVLAGLALLTAPAGRRQALAAAAAMLATAGVIVAPWLARNFAAYGKPSISSASAHVLAIGNNECLASEPIGRAYWAEDACAATDARRVPVLAGLSVEQRQSAAITERLDGAIGMAYIREYPVDYMRLSIRRAWSVLLPFHPRQQTGRVQKAAMLLYWLLVLPAGIAGLVQAVRTVRSEPLILAVLVVVTILPLVLVYFSPDGRHRVPADLLLGCFAGYFYARLLSRYVSTAAG